LPRLADLPQAQRRELPPMVVSGAVQSPDPASRMLILDGQVLREGDAPAPGLLLERIGPRAAVFSRGGVRFEIPL
jgi:general secretion pathway protein B